MTERFEIPCLIDMRFNCNSDCKLYNSVLGFSIKEGILPKLFEASEALRKSSKTAQANQVTNSFLRLRILNVNPETCLNIENTTR